jgi:hypothetical protein
MLTPENPVVFLAIAIIAAAAIIAYKVIRSTKRQD